MLNYTMSYERESDAFIGLGLNKHILFLFGRVRFTTLVRKGKRQLWLNKNI